MALLCALLCAPQAAPHSPRVDAGLLPCPQATWDEAFEAYQSGAWPRARALLGACDQRRGRKGDGPARVLLGFMGEHGFSAPQWWSGFRELTEK